MTGTRAKHERKQKRNPGNETVRAFDVNGAGETLFYMSSMSSSSKFPYLQVSDFFLEATEFVNDHTA